MTSKRDAGKHPQRLQNPRHLEIISEWPHTFKDREIAAQFDMENLWADFRIKSLQKKNSEQKNESVEI